MVVYIVGCIARSFGVGSVVHALRSVCDFFRAVIFFSIFCVFLTIIPPHSFCYLLFILSLNSFPRSGGDSYCFSFSHSIRSFAQRGDWPTRTEVKDDKGRVPWLPRMNGTQEALGVWGGFDSFSQF